MEQIEFFEYAIIQKHCQIVQYKGIGKKVGDNLYKATFFDGERFVNSERHIRLSDFEQIKNYRILSFSDDYGYYRQMLLDAYKEMLENQERKLEKQQSFLKKLEQMAVGES